jgi:hypothetical protein
MPASRACSSAWRPSAGSCATTSPGPGWWTPSRTCLPMRTVLGLGQRMTPVEELGIRAIVTGVGAAQFIELPVGPLERTRRAAGTQPVSERVPKARAGDQSNTCRPITHPEKSDAARGRRRRGEAVYWIRALGLHPKTTPTRARWAGAGENEVNALCSDDYRLPDLVACATVTRDSHLRRRRGAPRSASACST